MVRCSLLDYCSSLHCVFVSEANCVCLTFLLVLLRIEIVPFVNTVIMVSKRGCLRTKIKNLHRVASTHAPSLVLQPTFRFTQVLEGNLYICPPCHLRLPYLQSRLERAPSIIPGPSPAVAISGTCAAPAGPSGCFLPILRIQKGLQRALRRSQSDTQTHSSPSGYQNRVFSRPIASQWRQIQQ